MAHFTVSLTAPVPALLAWQRVLDLRAHGEVIPFTSLTGDALSAGELGPGSQFVARTAWGALGFDDVMVVEALRPPQGGRPGFARIRKEGALIRGWIDLTITPHREHSPHHREHDPHDREHNPHDREHNRDHREYDRGRQTAGSTNEAEASCRVLWSQAISIRGVPKALDPVVAGCGRAAYGWALRRLLARA